MRLISVRYLHGPNVFTASPATVARLKLDELTGQETTGYPGFAGRLTQLLPGLAGHHCAADRPGGFLAAMDRGTYFGHVTEHVALELSALAGREVGHGRTLWAGADGHYDVMMECPRDEPDSSRVPELLLRTAIRVTQDVLAGRPAQVDADVAEIAHWSQRERPGLSTSAIAAAARRRGIPVRRMAGLSMLRLGSGCHQHLVCAALTDRSSAVGVDIAADKMLAKHLLSAAGIPVAEGILVTSAAEAQQALADLGAPVVIKPLGGNHGRCVTVGVTTAGQAAAAFAKASTAGAAGPANAAGAAGPAVIVESYVTGCDYRVLVIDGQIAAAAELRPASVTGDGEQTIAQLIDAANADPRRGDGHARELTRIILDDEALRHLDAAGLDGRSVPAPGHVVALRQNANLSTGGTSRDVTDLVHEDVAAMCRRAAAVAGLDICGIDVRLADIAAPAASSGQPAGAVIELNACPGLRMHLAPAEGQPRDVAAAVVDRLYPPGLPARVPVIAVTGTNGKTTTVRMVAHVLGQAGLRVGLADTDGVWIGGRLVYQADASGPRSAQTVLDDTSVEAAVLETARGGIIRSGLAYDEADVAVVTNLTADHLGTDGIDTLDELIHVKALVAEAIRPGGSVVLNADDPAVAALADRAAVRRRDPVIRYFSVQPASPVLAQHQRRGGLGYSVADGEIIETEADERRPILRLADLPGAFGGRAGHVVANALAAVAACRAAGISAKDIRRGLATFAPAANPGRGNVYRAGGRPVILDYGHNAAALDATGAMISAVWPGPAAAAVTLPGDRRDDLTSQSAEAVAAWFGHVVIYEDADKRGRQPGEMQALIAAALRAARPDITCEFADGPEQALRAALSHAAGGPVLFLYEKLTAAHQALAAIGAQPASEQPAAATGRLPPMDAE